MTRTATVLFSAMLLFTSSAEAFTTTCRLAGKTKDAKSSTRIVQSVIGGGGNSATVVQSGGGGKTVIVQQSSVTDNHVKIAQSASKRVDIETNTAPVPVELYRQDKTFAAKEVVSVPVPAGLTQLDIAITSQQNANVDVRDKPKRDSAKASSIRISQDGQQCNIRVAPANEGELLFTVTAADKLLLEVMGK